MNIIEVSNLKKNYGNRNVLKGLTFEVGESEILGLLGPNGAGKSSTINILSTVLKATEGKILFMGKDIHTDVKNYKRNIGIVPQNLALFQNLTAIENVKFFASFYELKGKRLNHRAEEVLSMVGLLGRAKELPKTFSGGMKRRLNIACALAHEPKLLILDEPTVGIDPQSRNYILEVIKDLRAKGTTVIYTTHYMEEVEAICDRVIIIDDGSIIAEGAISDLTKSDNEIYHLQGKGIENLNLNAVCSVKGVNAAEFRDGLKVTVSKNIIGINLLIQKMIENKVEITSIVKEEENLETIFLNLTGKRLRDKEG